MNTEVMDSLHPLERKVLPALKDSSTLNDVIKKTGLKQVEVMRALQWLQDKNILTLNSEQKEIIAITELGKNVLKNSLPEKKFITHLPATLDKLKQIFNKDELNISIGILKKANAIEIGKQVRALPSAKAILENNQVEDFLISLPKESDNTSKELTSQLIKRNLVKKEIAKLWNIKLTELGKKLAITNLKTELIEALTPELLQTGKWKHKKFRAYDINSEVKKIYPGKRHFVNQSISKARRIWLDMGFEEMQGSTIQSEFWNFDSLFIPQDHPAREMQDTFFLKQDLALPKKEIVGRIRQAHEKGVEGSKGWQYKWSENLARKSVLRTHTTVLSAQTLAKLDLKDLPKKFFAIGRNYRNESLDWAHLFEFNQTEGIVIDENATFRDLLGYLKEFANKMGFKKIRFRPAYFPYTEPSVEGDVYDEKHKKWIELIAAGIFRPEVVIPLLGKNIPVLAWGPGLDRMTMVNYELADLRDLYKNDLRQLREIKCLL